MRCPTIIFMFLAFTLGGSPFMVSSVAYSLATVQDTSTWEMYSSHGEELAYPMPEQPAVTILYRPQSYTRKTKPGTMFAAYENGTVYVVMSFDNRSPKDSLDTYIKEFPQYPVFRNNLTFERDVTLLSFDGKQYRAKSANAEGIVQFYLTKNHAYIFEVVSDDINKPAVNHFLSAITANDKTKGKDLSDNIHTGGKAVAPVSSPATASDIPANQDAVLKSTQVTRKFVVVTMPIPEYTEEARRHQTAGKVRVRTVFSSSGKVINITPIDTLPFGLTEKAVEAVQRLKFIPSVKDGKYVSTYTMLELTFNIY